MTPNLKKGETGHLARLNLLASESGRPWVSMFQKTKGGWISDHWKTITSTSRSVTNQAYMAVGQNQWHDFGVAAPPIVVYLGCSLGVRAFDP